MKLAINFYPMNVLITKFYPVDPDARIIQDDPYDTATQVYYAYPPKYTPIKGTRLLKYAKIYQTFTVVNVVPPEGETE